MTRTKSSGRTPRPTAVRKTTPAAVSGPNPATASTVAPAPAGNRSVARQRILVVDDHPANCELLEALLVPHGYAVDSVNSGAEALVVARTNAPDLILLDVNMPEMDGFEVARRLRGADETRMIPLVMVTALGDLEHRVRGLESGADDYLAKPVNRTELLARVQSTLRLSYFRRQVDERQKLDLVLADVSDGIVITDAAGQLREANQCARRLLGMQGEAQGRSLTSIWGELQGVSGELMPALQQGRRLDFVAHREEPPLFVAASLRPVHDMDGQSTGAVLSLRDVTRETLEHKLQEDALSLVSHKFRTPLTVLTLWTKLLLDGECGTLAAEQREALVAMTSASEQLRSLLEGMLSYLDWTRRLHRLQRRPVTFENLEAALRDRVQASIGTANRLAFERDPGGEVVVDEDLFIEALGELVGNAIKFGGGKPITVRVEMHSEGERRRIVVADNGPGIPPEKLERIFERFYQVESEFTGQVHGVGLGLALVKAAVEALGGRIQAHSQLQQGTRFEILL